MKAFRSIRWRLQLWYGALFAAVLTGLGVTAYEVEANSRLERADDELERRAFVLTNVARSWGGPPSPRRGDGAGGAPEAAAPRRPARPRQAVSEVLSAADEARGFYFAVWRKNGEPRFTASAGAPPDVPMPSEERPQTVRQRGAFREALIVTNPGDVALVGRAMDEDFAELRRLGWLLAGGGLSIFFITMAIGWWLVTRALQPIGDISGAAAKIATGDLAQRIDTRDTESELGALAGVLNSTFARLEASFAQQARFTADAAHELRTPVTVILTHVQNALAEGGLSEEQREAFDACQRAAQRMRRMIESLLQLARLDAGQEAMQHGRVDLAEVVDECVELIRPIAAARRITIAADLAAADCRGDAGRLAQIVTNLISNAIHHNRDGGAVRVTTRNEEGAAVVAVADNGPGIAAEHVGQIFGRFYRVDKARTGAAGRTGLGLAISKAIVDAHGGTIEVASVVGEGATFTVRVPGA